MTSPTNVALVTLTLALALAPAHAGLLYHKAYVQIANELGDGKDLTLHCKSKQDDLGEHMLTQESTYGFRFRPSFWGQTQFFCHMWWSGEKGRYFDIYIEDRDVGRCHDCCWIVKENGPCLCTDCAVPCKTLGPCYKWNEGTQDSIIV